MQNKKLLVSPAEQPNDGSSDGSLADIIDVPSDLLRKRTRRDVLIFGASALAALAAGAVLLPDETLQRIGIHRKLNPRGKEWLLDRAINIDDDVAEALYSSK